MNDRAKIESVIGMLDRVVSADGGALAVGEYDPAASRLVVSYRQGRNDHCQTCVLDNDSMKAFVMESFEMRGLKIATVIVEN